MHFSPPFSTAKARPNGHKPNGIGHNTSVTQRKPTADEATTIVHTAESRSHSVESRATRAALPLRALHPPSISPHTTPAIRTLEFEGRRVAFSPRSRRTPHRPFVSDSPLRRAPLLIYLSSRLSFPPRPSPKRALVRAPFRPMSSVPTSPLAGRHIVLGITGSIAAYKACTLVRLLVRQGAEVQVVITPAGKEFVTPLTLATLSQRAVVSEFFDRRDGSWHSHVDLGLWADVFVIAPASAATLGKMAHGIADNMLLTTYLSMKAPTFVAPAMDLDMYAHAATQDNLDLLRRRGVHVIEAADGFLASTLSGKGRMQEPEVIVEHLARHFAASAAPTTPCGENTAESATAAEAACHNAALSASAYESPSGAPLVSPIDGRRQRLLITAGPTRERIDPVRFVSNYSSGKMGFALAESAARAGFDVVLIAGPVGLTVQSPHIRRIDVESAREMHAAALREFPDCAGAILCAAVADYAPEAPADRKIKRETTGPLTLRLVPNPDIAADLGLRKRADQWLVGFALETDHALDNARGKLRRKHLDLIVLNSLSDAGAGFNTDTNRVTLIAPEGEPQALPLMAKSAVADTLIRHLCHTFPSSRS